MLAELSRAGFLVGPITPDPGEDLWAELEGRRAIAEGDFPLRALFQVRATKHDGECILDIDLDQIKRWAAQPLPVFLVGVSTPVEKLFAKSIDDIVSEDLGGKDPFEMKTKSVRVRPRAVEDLGAIVRAAIHQHYESLRLELMNVPDSEIKSHYFEILSRRNPDVGASIPTAAWAVLWKSQPRPQHFAAMVTELTRRARQRYEGVEPRPMLFFFNVFRSSEDRHYNLAAARVDVVNPDHPNAEKLRKDLEIHDGCRVRRDRDVPASREYFQTITMTPEGFREYAIRVGQALDSLSETVLAKGAGGRPVWDDELNEEFKAVDAVWNNMTLAPPECHGVEAILEEHFQCLLEHKVVERNRANRFPAAMAAEMLRDLETRLEQCRGSWAVALRIER